ncbi:hypothetical protein GCM10023322_52200 [Rugosimonospora acidiphila]|uniref:ATP-dependent helicase HepA n=2 Tax=Rugosimonospora acidiphila TaxID=556531 RepID=A0ABP9SAN7_9ACTN
MSGGISSAIELHEHQIETAWRVLQDPVQRYLLADEVGLGKTIEAGIVLRQLLMDNPDLRVQLILPPYLVEQWQRELRTKFRIQDFTRADIRFGRDDDSSSWTSADLIVVDEAHNLARFAGSDRPDLATRYEHLAEIARSTPRLLLLSATPALHNEQIFLAMLRLLEPILHRHTTADALRERLESRGGLGRLLLGLSPGLPGFLLKERVAEIVGQLPDDDDLAALADDARRAINETNKVKLTTALGAIHAHIADVYRVHRRMLRTRRTEALGGTYRVTGRAAPVPVAIRDTALAEINLLLDDWRQEVLGANETDPGALRELGRDFAAAVSLSLDPEALRQWARQRRPATGEEESILERIDAGLVYVDRLESIVRPIVHELVGLLGARDRAVVFCPSASMAEELAKALMDETPRLPVHLHVSTTPPPEAEQQVRGFEASKAAAVLVADSSAEEGRNLQFADLLVHVGLPPRANRLEQRIGRLDRWDPGRSGDRWRSQVFLDAHSSFLGAWFRILNDGFGIFENSVASLQHAVDEATDAAWTMLLTDGAAAIGTATAAAKSTLSEELAHIREQDALDSIIATAREDSVFQRLAEVEARQSEFAALTDRLLASGEGNLRFSKLLDPVHSIGSYEAVQWVRGKAEFPLVPTMRLLRDFAPLRGHRGTFLRQTAVGGDDLHLYRYGDPFIDAVSDFLRNDDRGRAFGMWRWIPGWRKAEQTVYRFDYAVEANPFDHLASASEGDTLQGFGLDEFALRRRSDGLFPPLITSLWLDYRGRVVTDDLQLAALSHPYRKPRGDEPGGDYALNRGRIRYAYEVVSEDRWAATWRKVETAAQDIIRNSDEVRQAVARGLAAAEQDQTTRLRQLRLRATRSSDAEREALQRETEREVAVGHAIQRAIASPSLHLDSTGVVIVSGRGLDQDETE